METFGIRKHQLITNLKRLRQKRCDSPISLEETCDCTFGVALHYGLDTSQTGCMELRQLISMLEFMDDETFTLLCKKSGVIL